MNSVKQKSSRNSGEIDFLHADANQKALFLKSILDDDIKSGFFMVFCESQFCTENIRFVVATIKHNRLYENDGLSWSPWETDLGKNLNNDKRIFNEMDPQKCAEIERDIEYIHNRFLKPSAPYEICISSEVLENTRRRMKEYNLYGPEVFKEARIDPMNTLIKDILPRFVVSSVYEEMLFYVKRLCDLPAANTLTVNPPNSLTSTAMSRKVKSTVTDVALSKLETEEDIKKYCSESMDTYFLDTLLYSQLLKYLNRIVSSENLLCIRAINIFPQLFDDSNTTFVNNNGETTSTTTLSCKNKSGLVEKKSRATLQREAIRDQAWLIYMYFLAPGAAYEVGVSSTIARSVALNMAKPEKNMFETTKAAAMTVLSQAFVEYLKSPEFQELLTLAKARMEDKSNGDTAAAPRKTTFPDIKVKGWFSSS